MLTNAAPSTYPSNFECISLGSRHITLIWEEVDIKKQNGPILGYHVRRHGSTHNPKVYDIDVEMRTLVVLVDLHPGKKYAFSIAAFNEAGDGPFSPVLFVPALEEEL